jgi:hypothetical protein
VRGLIGETWRLLRSRGSAILLVALVLLLPAELAVAHAREDSETLWIAALIVLNAVGYAWLFAAVITILDRRARPPLEPYAKTVDRLPALVAANLAAGVAIVVGLVLLVVPGLLLWARWSAAAPLIVLEGKGPIEALQLSNDLVRGRTWKVVGALLLILLVCLPLAVPGFLITESSHSPWAKGLGEVLVGLAVFLPPTTLNYAVYRWVRDV